MSDTAAMARAFAALHKAGDPVILYNAWDAGSAKAVAEAGAKAIATGSWSVAAANGYSDAEAQLSRSIALRPDYFGSNALLGATLYLLKRDEEAYRVLDHAHQLNPSSEDTATLLFQEAMLLGQRNFQGRNYEDALRYWRKAAGIRPDDAAVRERIAGAMALAAEERH